MACSQGFAASSAYWLPATAYSFHSVGCRHVDFLFLLPLAHAFHQLQVQLLYSNVLFIDDVRAVLHCIFLLSDDLVELLDYKIGALDLFRCLLFLELELFLEHSHVLFIGLQLYLIHILLIVKLGLNLLPLGTGTCFLIFKFFLEFFNLTDLWCQLFLYFDWTIL
jgi:hypothetical protein